MTRPPVLLVGLGRWGEKHLRVLRELGAEVWAADLAEERRAWALAQGLPAARVSADYRDALARVHAVDIVTPADDHRGVGETALAAGKSCFVEKPLAASLADARRLAGLDGTSGRIVQVGHIFRFHPVTGALRRALAAGRIGRVRFASGRFAGFKRPRTDVGVTHTDAIHYFDLFAHLFARPASRVLAIQRDYLGRGLDDMSVSHVEYGDIATVVEANYFVPGTHRECVIVGDVGTLEADFGAGTVTLHTGTHRRGDRGWEAVDTGKEALVVGGEEPLRLELGAFLDAVAGRAANAVPAADGVHALEIVEAAARAARLGRAVTLDEVRG